MMRTLLSMIVPVALIGAGFSYNAAAADVLTAVKTAQPPKLAAGAADAVWSKAKPLTVKLGGGKNFKDGSTSVLLKSVYSGDMLYLLVQYADPTQSVRRSPFVKQPDGSWTKLVDPDDKGGDNNKYYEDKFAIIWNIGNSIKGIATIDDRFQLTRSEQRQHLCGELACHGGLLFEWSCPKCGANPAGTLHQ